MILRSDNVSGVSPEILAAITRVATLEMPPYGDDPVTARLGERFAELFGRECVVAPVSSGTAANGLGLSLLAGPLESAVVHVDAHVARAEAGSFELFTQGARLVTLDHPDGRLDAQRLDAYLGAMDANQASLMPARAVSITQATERGTLYRVEDVRAIAEVAHRHGLAVHMDGTRIANAVAALGCSMADVTWRAGVDVLSFGASKNGGMNADAVVVFDAARTATLARRRRRSGQLVSKMRFMSAQLEAYLVDDLWLRNARHANAAACTLAAGLAAMPGVELVHPVEANLIFLRIEPALQQRLVAAGVEFRPASGAHAAPRHFRLVTSFATQAADIEALLQAFRNATARSA